MRMCAVTREKLPKKELVRLVVAEDKVVVDLNGRVRGRGLNIKPDLEVFDTLLKTNGIKRGLKVSLTVEQIATLRKEFEEYLKAKDRGVQVVRISSDKLDELLKRK